MRLDTVLGPAEIDSLPNRDLSDTVCVVFDVLRATSSMITGLAHGVEEIYPVTSIDEAVALHSKIPDALLGGERHGEHIEGFDLGNSPLEYRALGQARVITTTTNGTVALRACAQAKQVFAGALLNAAAVVRLLASAENILLVCAGTFRDPALEDMVAAGLVASSFPGAIFSDATQAVLALWQRHRENLYEALALSSNGQVLLGKKRDEELRWCAQQSVFQIVGKLRDGVLLPVHG